MKDKLPNVLNSTKKHHKQIKKEILFAFFFSNFIPSVADSGTTTEGALSCQFEDGIRIPPTTAESHFLSLVNTKWTLLKCLNRTRQSFRYTRSEDINPKMSPGSTEIMKMELFWKADLKILKYYYLSVTPFIFAAVEILYCSYFSSAWMTSTLYTSYVYQCKSIRHKSMLAD